MNKKIESDLLKIYEISQQEKELKKTQKKITWQLRWKI
ncbi:hypothetical protein AB668_02145 [Mycoplasma sp. HU2014]|nr:hypothetical protein AB668_02145 [Mycoplasma sp. HU2014]